MNFVLPLFSFCLVAFFFLSCMNNIVYYSGYVDAVVCFCQPLPVLLEKNTFILPKKDTDYNKVRTLAPAIRKVLKKTPYGGGL